MEPKYKVGDKIYSVHSGSSGADQPIYTFQDNKTELDYGTNEWLLKPFPARITHIEKFKWERGESEEYWCYLVKESTGWLHLTPEDKLYPTELAWVKNQIKQFQSDVQHNQKTLKKAKAICILWKKRYEKLKEVNK